MTKLENFKEIASLEVLPIGEDKTYLKLIFNTMSIIFQVGGLR